MDISASVILSTSISVSTFFLGFIIKERISIYSKNKGLKDSDGYIKWNFKNTIDSIPKQIKGFHILIKCIEGEGYRNWFIVPELVPKNIIDKQELLHKLIFERKKGSYEEKNEIYNGLISNCYLLNSIIEESTLMFDKLNLEILGYETLLDRTGVKLFQKIMKLDSKDDWDKIESQILAIYDEFEKIEVKKRSLVYKELVQKIENLLIDNRYSGLHDLLELTSTYNMDFDYYKITMEQFLLKIHEYKQDLLSVYQNLNFYYDKYNNLVFKQSI